MQNDSITLTPIGTLNCDSNYRFEAPRQSTLAKNRGVIELNAGSNFEQALEELEQFDRIWVVYSFHLNKNWKPKITPPRSDKKIGLFATRSPHRPNQIGLSCVEIEKVVGRKIYIKNFDLINNTPILDIKPYIPYCDSFPNATTGWLPETTTAYSIEVTEGCTSQIKWVLEHTDFDLLSFAQVQLGEDPLNKKRKRVKQTSETTATLAYRTWRIHFTIKAQTIVLTSISSGYTAQDQLDPIDKYLDKATHRAFNKTFPN